jgi:hypothetical protein
MAIACGPRLPSRRGIRASITANRTAAPAVFTETMASDRAPTEHDGETPRAATTVTVGIASPFRPFDCHPSNGRRSRPGTEGGRALVPTLPHTGVSCKGQSLPGLDHLRKRFALPVSGGLLDRVESQVMLTDT